MTQMTRTALQRIEKKTNEETLHRIEKHYTELRNGTNYEQNTTTNEEIERIMNRTL